MPHGAIIGLTSSGKTFLARSLARGFMAAKFPSQGLKVLALRKRRETWGDDECDFQTSVPELFIQQYKQQAKINWENGTHSVAFLELSDADAAKYDKRFRKLFTEGRHDGFRFFYLAQRGAMVHPDIRENCVSLYLFTCGGDAAKTWSEEFCDKELLKAATLPARCFMHKASRYSPAQMRTLSVKTKS
jgi:hypothetical protein